MDRANAYQFDEFVMESEEPRADFQGDSEFQKTLDSMRNHRILSAEEEYELGVTIQEGLKAKEELETANGNLNQSEKDGLTGVIEAGQQAKDFFVRHNFRLVFSIARRYTAHHLSFEDLIQEGNLGLMKAAEKFDPYKGFKFSTYATWWIKQSITRATRSSSQTIKPPTHSTDYLRLVFKAEQSLKGIGKPTSPENIAEASGLELDKVKNILAHRVSVVASLDQTFGPDDSATLLEFRASDSNTEEEAIDNLKQENLRRVLRFAMSQLTDDMERDILIRSRGLEGREQESRTAIASYYGIPKEQVRKILYKAETKVKKVIVEHNLLD